MTTWQYDRSRLRRELAVIYYNYGLNHDNTRKVEVVVPKVLKNPGGQAGRQGPTTTGRSITMLREGGGAWGAVMMRAERSSELLVEIWQPTSERQSMVEAFKR